MPEPLLMALDIGGANIKAAFMEKSPDGMHRLYSKKHVFPIWKKSDQFQELLAGIRPDRPLKGLAVTLTAELSDVFESKKEGVEFVIESIFSVFKDTEIYVLNTAAGFLNPEEALKRPLAVAGANWAASTYAAAKLFDEGILADTGSTTTDLIPFCNGKVAASGRTDPERLASGELVYTGILRTPCSNLAPSIPFRGNYCRVSPEYFSITGDIHVIRGNISPCDYHWPTPDGRPNTPGYARARLARIICGDTDMLTEKEINHIALYLYERQIQQITEALYQVLSRFGRPLPAVCVGDGAFLVEAAATRLNLAVTKLEDRIGRNNSRLFPVWALCLLLAEKMEGINAIERLAKDNG